MHSHFGSSPQPYTTTGPVMIVALLSVLMVFACIAEACPYGARWQLKGPGSGGGGGLRLRLPSHNWFVDLCGQSGVSLKLQREAPTGDPQLGLLIASCGKVYEDLLTPWDGEEQLLWDYHEMRSDAVTSACTNSGAFVADGIQTARMWILTFFVSRARH